MVLVEEVLAEEFLVAAIFAAEMEEVQTLTLRSELEAEGEVPEEGVHFSALNRRDRL